MSIKLSQEDWQKIQRIGRNSPPIRWDTNQRYLDKQDYELVEYRWLIPIAQQMHSLKRKIGRWKSNQYWMVYNERERYPIEGRTRRYNQYLALGDKIASAEKRWWSLRLKRWTWTKKENEP